VADPLKSFGDTARGLSRNPLGIIALFIVLVYGMAAVVTALPSSTTPGEKLPLIYFLVLFPVLVLGVFTWLVICYPTNLFGPGDYQREETYVESVTRKIVARVGSVSASLAAASARMQGDDNAPVNVDIERIAEVVKRTVSEEGSTVPGSKRERKLEAWRNRILWVDDRPDNNRNERAAFEASGFSFELARSTQEALDILRKHSFGAIISDMGRKEGSREENVPQAGYVLLDALRSQGDKTPFFIYAGSRSPEHRAKTREHGGQGCTNDASELYSMVTSAIFGDRANVDERNR
jgi:CheY-like chemotaxis protein